MENETVYKTSCTANQLIGCYMRATLSLNGLNTISLILVSLFHVLLLVLLHGYYIIVIIIVVNPSYNVFVFHVLFILTFILAVIITIVIIIMFLLLLLSLFNF